MMDSDSENNCDHVHQPTYTPTKLPLLISRPGMAADAPSPLSPPQNTISVPFKWEEAPGKPRHSHTESEPDNSVKKTLELPPRLLFLLDTNVDGPSPTTVLDGPYVGRAVSFTTSYRTPRGYWNSNFGSSRWGGYKKITTDDGEGSFDFSPRCSSTTMPNVKITRVPRKGTFWTLSKQRSQLWIFLVVAIEKFLLAFGRKTKNILQIIQVNDERQAFMKALSKWSHGNASNKLRKNVLPNSTLFDLLDFYFCQM